ncbi:L-aminoadipate-semialdehyde dehydrogenase [Mycena venus]|uniref:L-aminoadipate-semialdehyde dehydrogenase n=1 Tax=Mycena venus TaxID=2733690 RepID=A0A8H6XSX5_9AGAR|nr:L-aminoadipate-semialdehyde dehydrogenase [Mycena venus]
MSFDELMPRELWNEILQDLPRETLQNLALSHRTLHRISRPFLFVTFVFHPYGVPYSPQKLDRVQWPEANEPLLFSQEVQDRELERLDFWSSTEIAPLVRTCRLTPVVIGKTWGAENESDLEIALLTAFFERLPRFTSIQYLHAYLVRFTQTGLANLCLLPALSQLEIVLGTMVEPIDCSSLHLSRVTSFRLQHTRHSSPNVVDSWMRLLPNQLVEMYLGFGPHLFADIAQNIPPFPHVRKLTLRALRIGDRLNPMNASPVLPPILSKFSGVEVFVMEGYWPVSDHVPSEFSHLLPIVKEYVGLKDMLPILLSQPTLSLITTGWISWPWIMETLCAPQSFNRVVSLTANSSRMDSTEFRFLFEIFPFLSMLNLNITHGQQDRPNSLRKAFLENITRVPTWLEFLSIRWKNSEAEYSSSDSEDDASTSDGGTGESRHIIELRTLVARCPALTSVWIENDDFLFRWHRLFDGTVDERTALDAGEFINCASLV